MLHAKINAYKFAHMYVGLCAFMLKYWCAYVCDLTGVLHCRIGEYLRIGFRWRESIGEMNFLVICRYQPTGSQVPNALGLNPEIWLVRFILYLF